MKKVKLLLTMTLAFCLFTSQGVLAADLPDATKSVAESPDLADEMYEATPGDATDVLDEAEVEMQGEDVPEESGEVNTQEESRIIELDADSLYMSTPVLYKSEGLIITFKLNDNKQIFDGPKSKIVFVANEGMEDETTINYGLVYNKFDGTYTGFNPLNMEGVKEAELTVQRIELYATNGDHYTITNGQSGNPDYNSNTQDLSYFDLIYVNTPYPFQDIDTRAWYRGTVNVVNYLGIMTGTKPSVFAPTSTLSRAQFATIIYRMEDCPEVEYNTTFTDVPKGQFYTDAVIWANNAGIITGYNSKTFGPADRITREQMATMMYRYAKYNGFDVSGQADLTKFPDYQSITDYAKEAVTWANNKEIITGDGGKINPHGNVSRAVCATIIVRFLNAYL